MLSYLGQCEHKGAAMNNYARTTGISQAHPRKSPKCNYPIVSKSNAIPLSSASVDRALPVLALGQRGEVVSVWGALMSMPALATPYSLFLSPAHQTLFAG